MANTVALSCDNCPKDNNENCCRNCFVGKKTNIFNALNTAELDFLLSGKKQLQYGPGEVIINQHDPAGFGVCLREGIVKVSITGSKNKNLLLRLGTKRDFITGGSIYEQETYFCTITALTPVIVCFIDSATLKKLIYSNKEFASNLMRYYSLQRQYIINKITGLSQKYAPGRVADTLLYLKNEIYKSNPFSIDLSRSELAELSNLAMESFVRTFMDFKRDGLIKIERKTIEIISENDLIKISRRG